MCLVCQNLCSWLKVPNVKRKCFEYFQKFDLNYYFLVESSPFTNILQNIRQNYGKEQMGCQGHLLCHGSLTVGLFAFFILTLHLLLTL